MENRRRNKRTELNEKHIIRRLDDDDHMETVIEIIDVSKCGMGFYCEDVLKKGAVYEIDLTIWTKAVIHAFIQIVRIIVRETTIEYGAVFVGMSEMDASRIEVYQMVSENE